MQTSSPISPLVYVGPIPFHTFGKFKDSSQGIPSGTIQVRISEPHGQSLMLRVKNLVVVRERFQNSTGYTPTFYTDKNKISSLHKVVDALLKENSPADAIALLMAATPTAKKAVLEKVFSNFGTLPSGLALLLLSNFIENNDFANIVWALDAIHSQTKDDAIRQAIHFLTQSDPDTANIYTDKFNIALNEPLPQQKPTSKKLA